MRKYILSILTFLGLFVLSGCGGGSDNISNSGNSGSAAPAESNPAVEVRPTAMQIEGARYTLSVAFRKKVDSSYKIELSNFNLTTDSCILDSAPVFTPDVLHMNSGVDSTASVSVSGTFDKNCSATKYTFSATQKTTKDGKVDTRAFSVEYDSSNPGDVVPVPSSGFFNATTPLEISKADHSYEIKVQMLEDGYAASGKLVNLKLSVNNVVSLQLLILKT